MIFRADYINSRAGCSNISSCESDFAIITVTSVYQGICAAGCCTISSWDIFEANYCHFNFNKIGHQVGGRFKQTLSIEFVQQAVA